MNIEEILRRAVQRKASDLLITIGRPPVLRIDGELEPQTDYPAFDSSTSQRLIFEIVPEDRRKQLEETFELDFSYSIPEVSRFRVNIYYRNGGMAAAQTIDRIVAVFPPYQQQQQIRIQLTGALRAVISQILLQRKIGGSVAAREIMVVDRAISSLIREGKTHQLYGQIETGASDGMVTMEADVAILLENDVITYQTDLDAVNDEDTFQGIIDRFHTREASNSYGISSKHRRTPQI